MARVEHRVLLVALAEHADVELRGVRVVPDARVGESRPLNSAGKDRATEPTRLITMVRHDFFSGTTNSLLAKREISSH